MEARSFPGRGAGRGPLGSQAHPGSREEKIPAVTHRHRKKNIRVEDGLVPAVLFLCLMLLVLASGCTSDLKRPEVAITGVSLSGITPGESYVDVGIAIFNQNRIPVRVEHTVLRLFYWNGTSWDPLGSAYKGEFQVHANGETRILVPVSLNNTALCDLFWYLVSQPDVKVRIEGDVYADLLITSYPVSFEDERIFTRDDIFVLIANAVFKSLTGISLLPENPR